MAHLLAFVAKNHPLLREIMPEVVDFQDPVLSATIEDMCYSILPAQLKAAQGAHDSAAGMAANQWGLRRRIFVFTPEGSGEGKLMEVMLNPSYTPYARAHEVEPTCVVAYEGCFSVPLTVGQVKRFDAITAVYYTPKGERIERILEGWLARVFQHETDHLDGKLFDGVLDGCRGPECLHRYVFANRDELDDFWQGRVRIERSTKVSC